MKIGIYDPYLDDLGGGEKYMMTIAICLSKDFKVAVFWDNKDDLEKLSKRFLFDLSSISISKNIFSSKVAFLTRILETKKYDGIVVLSNGSIPFVLSKKLFVHIQQPLTHISDISLKTRFKLKRINKIFCNSYYTKSFIDKSFSINSSVLYPPVELCPQSGRKTNTILNVGRLRVKDVIIDGKSIGDYKKQTFLIEAFKKMINDGLKNWEFVLAVSVRNEDKYIFEEMKKATVGFPITFLVNRNNRELWEIYNKASIYWHATGFGEDLINHPEYAEHFGISTVEAMGAGVVPIVIDAGGQKEIVENGKNGFLWNTLSELTEKTKMLIDDKLLLEKMSKEAINRSKYFSGERFCKEVKAMINV